MTSHLLDCNLSPSKHVETIMHVKRTSSSFGSEPIPQSPLITYTVLDKMKRFAKTCLCSLQATRVHNQSLYLSTAQAFILCSCVLIVTSFFNQPVLQARGRGKKAPVYDAIGPKGPWSSHDGIGSGAAEATKIKVSVGRNQ